MLNMSGKSIANIENTKHRHMWEKVQRYNFVLTHTSGSQYLVAELGQVASLDMKYLVMAGHFKTYTPANQIPQDCEL